MAYKLKRYSEAVWFDHPEGGRFKIRAVPPKRFLELMEVCKKGKQIVKNTAGEDQIVDDYNDGKRSWLIFNEMVEAWEDIEGITSDMKAEEVKENFFNDMALRDWIADNSNSLLKLHEKAINGELKNSNTSQDGS